MPKNIIDIVDTAVKIGLGALISGATTYYITRLNHLRDFQKYREQRRSELLEEVAEQVERFSSATLKYWAFMVEHVRYKEKNEMPPIDLATRIKDSSQELFTSYAELSSAEAKLLLLGGEAPQICIREYGELVRNFRRTAFSENRDLTEKILNEFRENIINKRKEVFDNIKILYLGGSK